MAKRRNQQPRVYPHGPGAWRIYMDIYKKGTTTRKSQRTRVVNGTRTQAIRTLREWETERDAGRLLDRQNQPLGRYLEWFLTQKEMTLSINSFKSLIDHLQRVWKTDLHEIPLAALEMEHIQEVINRMDQVEGVSYGTIKNFRDALRSALNVAVKNEYIIKNPILNCVLPKEVRAKKTVWTMEQLEGFLGYFRDHRSMYTDAFDLVLYTGLRRAEISGLHWSMVNFDDNYIDMDRTRHVMPKLGPDRPGGGWYEKEPKTEMSLRYLEISPKCVALLRRIQAEQAHLRVAYPDRAWPDDPFVICKPDGTVTQPVSLSKNYKKIWLAYNRTLDEKQQLPYITPHGLRRHHASYLAELGYSSQMIAARLGHASTTITERVYIRTRPGAFADRAEKLDDFLPYPDQDDRPGFPDNLIDEM